MDLKEGSAVFLDAQNHEATNIGNTVIELLVVELKIANLCNYFLTFNFFS